MLIVKTALALAVLVDLAIFYYVPRSVRRPGFKMYIPGRGILAYRKWTN